MKTRQQIQKAHDLVLQAMMGRPSLPFNDDDRLALTRIAETLCWILDHSTGAAANFQLIVEELERAANQQGLKYPELPVLHEPSDN